MAVVQRLKAIGAGLLAGLVGTAVMVLLMTAGRFWLGISPPPEAIPDRFAPTLDIDTFFGLFGRFDGYNGLKKFGIRAGLTGLIAAGALVGLAYALVVENRRARRAGTTRFGLNRYGVRFVAITAAVLWVATLAVLWPVLDANYRGLPPSRARLATGLWLLVTYAAYGVTLLATYRWITRRPAADAPATSIGAPVPRRAVVAAAGAALLALPSFALLRRLYDDATFGYDGRPYSGPDIEPITPIVPEDRFYSVTKNVVDPDVSTSFWRLQVDGLVDGPRLYSFDDLVAMPATDQETTLMCISNAIGSGLFSNALWRGVPMRDLLATARPRDGAVEVLMHATDGYTDTIPFAKAMDPTTLVVYEMNGRPLPRRHGYPVRVVVPGWFGEKNMKWVTRLEVVDHDAKGFYEQQGWGPNFIHPTRSDIFAPRWRRGGGRDAFVEPFRLNQTATVRGRAFAGDRGVTKVEFSADDGQTWREARIDYPGTRLTWVFWSVEWRPPAPGEYRLLSRATDGTGTLQPPDERGIVPQGATGYHRVVARVEGA
ncbi:MAG: molybdopterin-dependent oxidoreductase [Chloroflexota bacterium]|nr:molybdopterin-dependent oxidoreductase [Chloroflexota bacterium]